MAERLWVPRMTEFRWTGFGEGDVARNGIILTSDGILAAGRLHVGVERGDGDVRLIAENADGEIDKDLSLLISRRHFELYVECDRLMLRVTGRSGLRINGKAYGRDKIIMLASGDLIQPLVKYADNFGLKTAFKVEHGRVREVQFARTPSSKRGA